MRDRDTCIQWCQSMDLLSTGKLCHLCGQAKRIVDSTRETAGSDTCIGKRYRCQQTRHLGRIAPHNLLQSLARNSWFECIKLTYAVASGWKYELFLNKIGNMPN